MNVKSGSYDFFRGEGFLPADKSAFPLLIDHQGGTPLAETSAALIAAWSFNYNGLYKIIDGFLSIAYFCEGLPVYFTLHRPSGTDKGALRRIVDTLYDLSRRAELPFLQIRCVEERFLKDFETIDGYDIHIEYHDNDSEYGYKTENFLDLKGTVNLNKRQRLTKLFKQKNISFRPITKKEAGLCLDIEDEWCRDKDCEYCKSFIGCEREALEVMVDVYDDRFYKGLFLCCDGIMKGYGIGEIINPSVGMVYFAKSPVQNYFLYVLYMMTKTFFSGLEYVNLDSDIGNKGIRMFKTHLGVYELWRKYICTYTIPEKQSR
jgi:hypothetical protein